jgi:predicted GNAT superfamily acetyltransferase
MEHDLDITIRVLETASEMAAVEDLQRVVWPGSETDIVPLHLLVTLAQNGGLVLGAFEAERLVGFLFGFPGLEESGSGFRMKHCSHQMGVLPEIQNKGVGFALKRAQWQLVRRQGLEQITWTYDPLESRNATLNISKLGAVCNTYKRTVYGEMRDGLNLGLPSDRFQVVLWVNSARVKERLSRYPRPRLDLAHYHQGGAEVINPTKINEAGMPVPPQLAEPFILDGNQQGKSRLLLVEIPSLFQALKQLDTNLAGVWRDHTRMLFENLFASGYLVTDFLYLPGEHPRSFYVLSDGESTLGG